jgi:type I restriction enzyme R subunit
LQYHGLLQAFSRTNRILNDIKVFGNIVCFRDLEQNINDAIALFGNKNARNIVILKSFNDYYYGYDDNNIHHDGYVELIQHLKKHFLISQIMGEQKEKRFIKLYGAILRIKNILSSFDEFLDKEILTEREFQDYQSLYLDLYDKNRNKIESNKASILNDVNFEIELVKQSEISIDYILSLVERYHQSNYKDKTVVLAQINRNVTSNPTLRSKMELINNFIKTINNQSNQK